MKQKISLKIIVGIMTIASIVSIAYFGDIRLKPKNRSKCAPLIQNAKVKKLFSYLKDNDATLEECLLNSGALCEAEMNKAYHKAIELNEYGLAIKLYHLGATDCYQQGKDILLVCINAGKFDLMSELIGPDYPIDLAHISAAKSLINVDQPNWAFIYQQEDSDERGFKEYQGKSKQMVAQILELYKEQHPMPKIEFLTHSNHLKAYSALFGQDAQKDFKRQLTQVLDQGYSFDVAKHGTQKRVIILDKEGRSVGIIKSKNELLAYAFDYNHFAKVPPATEVFIPEYGTVVVQKWATNTKMVREHQIKTENISEKTNLIEQLHHVRMLDIRLGNSDRNMGNLLITKQNDVCQLIPIDHDLIMFYIPSDLNWESHYLNVPFSKITAENIQKIDIEKDAASMRMFSYKDEEIKWMKLRTTLLKMAVNKKLELKEIDMLFRFYYYDFLDHVKDLSADSNEQQFEYAIAPHFDQSVSIISQPTEVWKLIGNNFEFYI